MVGLGELFRLIGFCQNMVAKYGICVRACQSICKLQLASWSGHFGRKLVPV